MKYQILTVLDRLAYFYKIQHVVFTGYVPWVNDINTPHKKEIGQTPQNWEPFSKLFIIGMNPPPMDFSGWAQTFDPFDFIFFTEHIPQCAEFIKTQPEYRGIILPYGTIISKRPDFKASAGLNPMGLPEYRELTPGIEGERECYIPDNWTPTVPVQGWFHIAAMGTGDLIAAELHGRLMQSGLYRASDAIHVAILGDQAQIDRMIESIFNKHSKYNVHHISNNLAEYEWASLKHMYKTVTEGGNFNLWYIHTKGASNCRPDVPLPIQKNIRRWRDLMSHYTIGEHRKCRFLLETEFDTVGSLLRHNTGCIAPYYAGNFWWATAEYIRSLPEPTEALISNRSNAEGWMTYPKEKGEHFNQFWSETMDLYGFDSFYDQGPFTGYEVI